MIDPQDPLPEPTWGWRRAFVWFVTITACALLGYIVQQLRGNASLAEVAKWLIGLIAYLVTCYLIAPSAEHITRVVQAGRTMRVGAVERAAAAIGAGRSEGDAP